MSSQESKYFTTASYMDEALLLLLETKDFEGSVKKDLPLSFSSFNREYGFRRIKEMKGKEIWT